MKWHRWVVIGGCIVLLIAALIYGYIPRPPGVDTAVVQRQPLSVIIEAEGRTRVKDAYLISAPVAGVNRRIQLNVGDPVMRGQAVAWLEPLRPAVLDPRSRAETEARLSAAEASLRVAEDNVEAAEVAAEFARAHLLRTRQLRDDGLISQEALEQAQAEARRTAANLRSARSAVEVARYQREAVRSALEYSAAISAGEATRDYVILRAPVDGRVLRIHQRSEDVVEPGRALLEVGDPGNLEVAVDVLSSDAVRIEPGHRVLLQRWGGPETLEGRVRVVEPVGFTKISALGVEEQRVLVIVDLASPPEQWQRLGDGYRVEAGFVVWEQDDVLQIPTSALLRRDGGWAVYVVEDGRARSRPVEVGQRSGLRVGILGGLSEGERVIVYPSDAVIDGVAVEVRS